MDAALVTGNLRQVVCRSKLPWLPLARGRLQKPSTPSGCNHTHLDVVYMFRIRLVHPFPCRVF